MYVRSGVVKAARIAFLGSVVTVLNLAGAFAQVAPNVEIRLNNNPRCAAEIESVAKGVKWRLTNVPEIAVEGSGFENEETALTVTCGHEVFGPKKVQVVNHCFTEVVELAAPLKDPKEVQVKVGDDFDTRMPVFVRRLRGTVRHFDGTPVPNPIVRVVDGGTPVAVGNVDGTFQLGLSGRVPRLAIFAQDYSKATVQCWVSDVALSQDTELDVRIGKLELYDIGAWVSSKESFVDIFIHFVPMSLTRIQQAMEKGPLKVEDPEVWPHLATEDVKVFLGDRPVSVKMLHEYSDPISKTGTRPAYIVAVAGENFAGQAVRVEVECRVTVDGQEVLEKGQGFFLGFLDRSYWK
jgi:hypothetical protein